MTQSFDDRIRQLGKPRFHSPVAPFICSPDDAVCYMPDDARIAFDPRIDSILRHQKEGGQVPSLELAGPRSRIYFKPDETRAVILTAGGLCPGINDVIRGIVMTLFYQYGVKSIFGARYGYRGLVADSGSELVPLMPSDVSRIHETGGSILASSRGNQDPVQMVDYLQAHRINIVFAIGGDGTVRGAAAIADEVTRRNLPISIIAIPKTIDNDILYIDRSFGFETAFSKAAQFIISAHNEARGNPNGIGLIKLMGRHSGFIACYAALAMNDVNFVLIPEVPFSLDGPDGFLDALRKRILTRKHAVIVVAEGAGQGIIDEPDLGSDDSGNTRLKDIGIYLRERINRYFELLGIEVNLKYIDPSYIIRSVPALPPDSVYCLTLAQHAAHAGMAGKTRMVVGKCNNHYVHLPMAAVAAGRKRVDPDGELWHSVLTATGQPVSFSPQSSRK